mgnify:CR=1 FL=1
MSVTLSRFGRAFAGGFGADAAAQMVERALAALLP